MAIFILTLTWRVSVVIYEYTYRKLLVGVLLLLHELYSKNSSSQAWKLGDIKLLSQQNNGGGASCHIYTGPRAR